MKKLLGLIFCTCSITGIYASSSVKGISNVNLASENETWLTDVTFNCVSDDGVIYIHPRRIAGLLPKFTPEDAATWSNVTWTLSDNGTDRNNMIASLYTVNYWMPSRVRFPELQGYRLGECKLTVTVKNPKDNTAEPFVKEFMVKVVPDTSETPEKGYVDGTIILNEEWYGHTNGSLNYITPDNHIIYHAYERENPGLAFGATSQFGTIWADKLLVVSKQATDGGDPLPGGGRLVVADAKSLKRLGSLELLSWNNMNGDGRAVAGATPEKIYITASNGVYIVDISDPAHPNVTGMIEGSSSDSGDLYNGQYGDIINTGKYVLTVRQSGGIMIIDPITDNVVKTISDNNIQGITQTGDGTIWYTTIVSEDSTSHTRFVSLNPDTLEETASYDFPSAIGNVVCSWGAWRSTAFYGSHTGNDIWFVTGASGITGGSTGSYYRFNPEENPAEIQPFFSLSDVKGSTEFGEEVAQMTYGTPRFDVRNNRLIVLTGKKGAASGEYRNHWIHFVDGDSGEITRSFTLEPYYWFQSLPIFPDKYDAEISLENISINVKDTALVLDLSESVTDEDNIDSNIRISIEDPQTSMFKAPEENVCAELSLEGKNLTVSPKFQGSRYFTLVAESNGKKSSKTLEIKVDDIGTGMSSIEESESGTISCNGNEIIFRGFEGVSFDMFAMNGTKMLTMEVDDNHFVARTNLPAGVYMLRGSNGLSTKITLY